MSRTLKKLIYACLTLQFLLNLCQDFYERVMMNLKTSQELV